MTNQFKIEVEIEIPINPIETLHVWHEVEVKVEHHIEKNYGADADGNRGIDFRAIDAVEIIAIKPHHKITESVKYQIERVAIEQLESHL